MKELVVWAHSYCRSTFAFYKGIGRAFGVPLKVCVWKENAKLRTKVGFTENEFSDMDITFVGNDYAKARNILNEHRDAHHIFGAYQSVKIFQILMIEAKNIGCRIGITSEAPCNMTPTGYKRILKNFYIRCFLPYVIKNQIGTSDFIINFSGDDSESLEKIGWPKTKIIPCGYYSPRIENTRLVKRDDRSWENFSILLSGIHQWHRSPMLLLKALNVLKQKGLSPKCDITQEGPLLNDMKKYVRHNHLDNVKFHGFVEMKTLINLYETCSVYVGTGNYEPWGMRLNDVLQCGAPLVVNRGMGGAKMVEDYGCGMIFGRNDYKGLATILENLILKKDLYCKVAEAAYNACLFIKPEVKAAEIVEIIRNNYKGW